MGANAKPDAVYIPLSCRLNTGKSSASCFEKFLPGSIGTEKLARVLKFNENRPTIILLSNKMLAELPLGGGGQICTANCQRIFYITF